VLFDIVGSVDNLVQVCATCTQKREARESKHKDKVAKLAAQVCHRQYSHVQRRSSGACSGNNVRYCAQTMQYPVWNDLVMLGRKPGRHA
jgi:hypothetical protein